MSKPHPSKASVPASSRNVGANASKAINASSYACSSRLQNNDTNAGSSGAQILLDGVDVTPRSLLWTRINPLFSQSMGKSVRTKRISKNSRSRTDPNSGSSVNNASAARSHNSSKDSIDHDNDSESSGESISLGSYSKTTSDTIIVPGIVVNGQDSENSKEFADGAEKDKAFASSIKYLSVKTDESLTKNTARLPDKLSYNQPKTIYFTETKTDFLFQLTSIRVSQELTQQHAAVEIRNIRYDQLCASKKGCDSFKTGRCQTIQLDQKTKEVMTAPPATKDVACHATEWDIYDTAQCEDIVSNENVISPTSQSALPISAYKRVTDVENTDQSFQQQVTEIVDAVLASPACVLDLEHDIIEDLKAQRQASRWNKKKNATSNSGNSSLNRRLRNGGSRALRSFAGSKGSHRMDKKGRYNGSNPSQTSQSGVSISFGVSQSIVEGGSSSTASPGSQRNSNILSGGASNTGARGYIKRENTAYARADPNLDLGDIIAKQKTHKLMTSPSLKKATSAMERAVQQNIYHSKQVLYRNFRLLNSSVSSTDANRSTEEDKDLPSKALQKLWTFTHESCSDKTVTCMTWNTANEDLLAVGYARSDNAEPSIQDSTIEMPNAIAIEIKPSMTVMGMILFWSLKNPESPERTYNFPESVTCAEFSSSSPYLLAVGFLNGIVSVYDIRREPYVSDSQTMSLQDLAPNPLCTPEPLATNQNSNGKHLDAVWQVRWVSKGSDRADNVVSISADGRVTEWNIKKELNYSDLMALKRISNPSLGSDPVSDGIISSQSSGLCFDFMPSDSSVYFVGTENGLVHKCSISYSEQYLFTYYGHAGPVYRLAVSTYSDNLFLTCGADWNIKLWDQTKQYELVNFHSIGAAHAVHDIAWCPSNPNMFAAVRENHYVEIWDIKASTLDPIVSYRNPSSKPKKIRKSAHDNMLQCQRVAFAPAAPVLVVGDCEGNVSVYCVAALARTSSNGDENSDVALEAVKALV